MVATQDLTQANVPVDLDVDKVVDRPFPTEGSTVTYTITVANNGPNTATGIEVADVLPADLGYRSHSASQGSYTSGSGVWNVGSLADSASATLQIRAMVGSSTAGSTITNAANVTRLDEGDTNPDNDADSAGIHVQSAASVPAFPSMDIGITAFAAGMLA